MTPYLQQLHHPSKLSFTPHKMNFPRLFAMKMIKRGIFIIPVLNNKHVMNTKGMTSVVKKCKHYKILIDANCISQVKFIKS